jgi:hypothetical protein
VLDRLHQSDELMLIGRQLGVARGHLVTKENATAPLPWCNTAPTPEPDASHSTMKSRSKSGSCNTGAIVKACCRVRNAVSASSDQQKPALRRSHVRGYASAP